MKTVQSERSTSKAVSTDMVNNIQLWQAKAETFLDPQCTSIKGRILTGSLGGALTTWKLMEGPI